MADNVFRNCRIYILPNGLLKKRIKLFEEQIVKYNGEVVTDRLTVGLNLTHVVVDDKLLMNPTLIKNSLEGISCDIVGTIWLSKCLKERKLLDTENFRLKNKRGLDDENLDENGSPIKVPKIEAQASVPSTDSYSTCVNSTEKHISNDVIINELQKLADAYRARGDRWRTLAYDKAIVSLKCYKKPITNINDLKLLPNISGKMMDKIAEIMENGFCSKVQEVCSDEKTQILDMFSKVWGAASKTAQLWYQKGCRTLEDLQTKGNLNHQQKLGLKYYNDIQESVPRQEVEQIINTVKTAVVNFDNCLRVVPCGSFRRGQPMCGDIDVLFVVPDNIKYQTVLPNIISKLKCDGFLIDDLVGGKEGAHLKYLGLCKLPGDNSKIRRLDLFIVPERKSACAIMHFTGSALFNRGIRVHALKMNMKLSENALIANASGDKYAVGYVFPTPTEKAIFEHLGLQYRPPEDRAFF